MRGGGLEAPRLRGSPLRHTPLPLAALIQRFGNLAQRQVHSGGEEADLGMSLGGWTWAGNAGYRLYETQGVRPEAGARNFEPSSTADEF